MVPQLQSVTIDLVLIFYPSAEFSSRTAVSIDSVTNAVDEQSTFLLLLVLELVLRGRRRGPESLFVFP